MDEKEHKIISYRTYSKILVILLLFTAITISITVIDLSAWTIMFALLIACFKGSIVMMYFMHLKFEKIMLRGLAIGVIVLLAMVLIITFSDYWYR